MKSAEHWLIHDHTQIEFLLGELNDACDTQNWHIMKRSLKELIRQLKYHMAQEEEVLFPAYDERTGPPHMPTMLLRKVHRDVIKILAELLSAIKVENLHVTQKLVAELQQAMLQHHEKEEKVFLPMASHILCEEREALSEALENFRLTKDPDYWTV